MKPVFGLLEIWLACFVVTGVMGVLGMLVVQLLSVSTEHTTRIPIQVCPVIGLAACSLLSLTVVSFGRSLGTTEVHLTIAAVAISGLLVPSVRHTREIRYTSSDLVLLLKSLSWYCLAGLLPYFFLFRREFYTSGFQTSATWTNNDLGAYLQMATNLVKAGHQDAGLVDGWNAGLASSFDHPAAMSLLAFVSSLLKRNPFQVGILTMSSLIAVLSLTSSWIISTLTRKQHKQVMIAGVVCAFNPVFVAAVVNFFLAQVIAVTLIIGAFAVSVAFAQEPKNLRPSAISLSVIFCACLLTSIEIALLLGPLIVSLALFFLSNNSSIRQRFYFLTVSITATTIIFLMHAETVSSQLEVLRRASGDAVAGWTTNLMSPLFILGLAPTEMGLRMTGLSGSLDMVCLVAIALLVSEFIRTENGRLTVNGLIMIGVLLAGAVVRWGADGYQSWKLLTSCIPVMYLLFLTGLGSPPNVDKFLVRRHVFFQSIPLFVLSATLGWSAWLWRDATPTSIVRPELSSIAMSDEMRRQPAINVDLAPFFETMAASSMMNRPVWMISPSYEYPEGNSPKYPCTLTTTDKISNQNSYGKVIAQRGNLVLVGTPECG